MSIQDKVRVLEMAEGPDDVKNILLEAGVAGWTSHGDKCPVARFLAQDKPIGTDVSVGMVYHHGAVAHLIGAGGTQRYELPGPVGDFICRFDTGDYAELESQQ